MKFPTHPEVFWWQPATWLRVSGSDAFNFLQGQFSNDLRALSREPAVYGLWLNVKGKVVADSFIVRGTVPDEFWIGSYFSAAAVILDRLERFVIADDVQIDDATGEWSATAVFGVGARAALSAETRAGFVFCGRRASEECTEWIFPVSMVDAARAAFAGLGEISAGEVARRRIDARIPAIPADLGSGDLPHEGGLEADALSFTKGCYLGQEVMARLNTMGQVRRRLVRVAIADGTLPILPAPIFLAGRQVGELRSAAPDGAGGFIGLAMVSLLHVTADAELAFTAEGPPTIKSIDLR
jgi:folate-binding protein YgfZ